MTNLSGKKKEQPVFTDGTARCVEPKCGYVCIRGWKGASHQCTRVDGVYLVTWRMKP